MKKIKPLARYDEDSAYPSTAEVEAEIEAGVDVGERSGRRSFLKELLAGAAAVGAGLWLGSEAEAQPRPRRRLLPPGVPPRPDKGPRPRPKNTPPVPGGGRQPQPNPLPPRQPCPTTQTSVKLDALFAFCDDRSGQVHVTTPDVQVVKMLRKPGEGRRLAPVIKPIFAREKSCGWLDHGLRKAQVESRLAKALTIAYQQALGGTIEPLKVRLIVHPQRTAPLPGVMPMPRPTSKRGCASCSTDASVASVENVLLPAGLVALALLARKKTT